MMQPVEQILAIHVTVVGGFLAVAATILFHRRLFHWNSAGFWAWAAFVMYFFLNPLASIMTNEVRRFHLAISMADGPQRAYWILGMTILGMTSFFYAYLRTRPARVTWRIINDRITPQMLAAIIVIVLAATFSLLTRRAFLIDTGRSVIMEGQQNIGQVTGYESVAHKFILVPLLMGLLSSQKHVKYTAWGIGLIWIVLSLPNGWGRQNLISMFIAFSMVDAVGRRKIWPRVWMIAIVILAGMIMQMRGHQRWDLGDSGAHIAEHTEHIRSSPTSAFLKVLSSADVRPLATWYVESYAADTIWGYSYGIPIVNYALVGWIPSRIFPNKYYLMNMMNAKRTATDSVFAAEFLRGTKSTLFGDFYSNGGWIGLILLAAFAGFLSRKLDGMLRPDVPILVRATGAAWMGGLWIMWHGSMPWGLMSMGSLAIPSLILWFCAQKHPFRR